MKIIKTIKNFSLFTKIVMLLPLVLVLIGIFVVIYQNIPPKMPKAPLLPFDLSDVETPQHEIVLVETYSNWAWGEEHSLSFVMTDGYLYRLPSCATLEEYNKIATYENMLKTAEKLKDKTAENYNNVDFENGFRTKISDNTLKIYYYLIQHSDELNSQLDEKEPFVETGRAFDAGKTETYIVCSPEEKIEIFQKGDISGYLNTPLIYKYRNYLIAEQQYQVALVDYHRELGNVN